MATSHSYDIVLSLAPVDASGKAADSSSLVQAQGSLSPGSTALNAGDSCSYSSDDELARAFDAEPWDEEDPGLLAKRCRREPTAAEVALFGNVHVLVRISSFSPSLHFSQLAVLNRCWDEATQIVWRQRAVAVLSDVATPPLAAQVEACVHAHCSLRAGPGAYNAKVRQLVLNLKGNAGLASGVRTGFLPPDRLVLLSSEQMRTAAAQRRDEGWRRAAAAAAVRQPTPAHVVNLYACPACGCARQWLRRRVRLSDITMATEFLVCVECHEIVPPVPSAALTAAASDVIAQTTLRGRLRHDMPVIGLIRQMLPDNAALGGIAASPFLSEVPVASAGEVSSDSASALPSGTVRST